MNRFWSRLGAVGASFLMVGATLIGLGGSSPASAAQSDNTPVSVGIICSCSGPLASSYIVGPPAYKAWASWVNSKGGINGHKVNVILKDDQSNEGTSLTDAQTLIQQDHVVALVDSTNNDTAWESLAQQSHVPVVGGGALSLLAISNPNIFSAQTTVDALVPAQVLTAKKVGAKSIGEFYCAEAPTCSELIAPLKSTAAKYGLKVGYVAEISSSAPNYTAQCLAAKQAGADILGAASATQVVAHVAQNCSQQGYSPYMGIGDGNVAKSFTQLPVLGTKGVGYETDIPFFINNTPAARTMYQALQKYAPSVLNSPNYGEMATTHWVSGLLFGAAAIAGGAGLHGPITSADIYKGLYTMHNETLGGMSPPLTFVEGQPNLVDCWYLFAIRNHKFVTPWGLKPTCVPKSPPSS